MALIAVIGIGLILYLGIVKVLPIIRRENESSGSLTPEKKELEEYLKIKEERRRRGIK